LDRVGAGIKGLMSLQRGKNHLLETQRLTLKYITDNYSNLVKLIWSILCNSQVGWWRIKPSISRGIACSI